MSNGAFEAIGHGSQATRINNSTIGELLAAIRYIPENDTMLHLSMILQGMLLGIGAAAPIGPVNVEIARRTLQSGFRSGFALGCGAVTVDVGYAILVSLSIRPAMSFPILIAIVGVLGAALMCYLGVSSLRHAMANKFTETSPASTVSSTRNYVTGLLLTSLNPMTLAFWFIAVPATVTRLTPAPAGDSRPTAAW